jgi:hypothetical protein
MRLNLAVKLSVIALAAGLTMNAATYTVAYEKTVMIPIVQATAAYAVDPSCAEASAYQGMVTVTGKIPCTTHVVVITPEGVQTIDIVVPMPPPFHPKGWVTPREVGSNESGYFESRYSSLPQQFTNVLDFARQGADMSTHFHLATTNFFPSPDNPFNSYAQSGFAVTSMSYTIATPNREVTLVDQQVDESPLTVTGAIVRGLHWQEGGWFFHGGYTSPAAFENIFLPIRREGVFGTGYRYRLTEHSSLTPSVFYLSMQGADHTGKPGLISSLRYTYRPSDDFRAMFEVGASRGFGGSFDLSYRSARDSLHARARYTPPDFAALSLSNFRGLYSDMSWTRKWSSKFGTDVNFTGNRFNLPGFQELTINGGLQLRYSVSNHWTLFGGATYSRFRLESPGQPALRGLYYPVGASFNSRHFGASFQHQWSSYTGQDSGGHQYLASMHSGWGQFGFNASVQRQTQAPSVSFLISQIQGLQQALTELGVTATTTEQINSFLNQNAALINLRYLQNVTVNLIPVREQVSGTVSWQGRGRQPQIDYEFLYNEDQSVTNSVQVAIQRVTMTQRLGTSNDISLTLAQYRTKMPGQPSQLNPLYAVSLRHHFNTAPGFLVLERHGTIKGRVFIDTEGQGIYAESAAGLAGVEIILDQRRRVRTGSDGSYRFGGVPEGKHTIQAVLHTDKPYYFTTAEQFDVDDEAEVYFGLAYSLSSLSGTVISETQHGVAGVVLNVVGEGRRLSFMTDSQGKVLVPRLTGGSYDVAVDAESLPPGYTLAQPMTEHLTLSAASPAKVELHVRALRSIAGRVLVYDRILGQYVPISGSHVTLQELSKEVMTDAEGRYLFRDLPIGVFTVSASYQDKTINQIVRLPEEPSQKDNVNLILGQR